MRVRECDVKRKEHNTQNAKRKTQNKEQRIDATNTTELTILYTAVQRQHLITLIINEVMQIQSEFESEYGGENNAVEKMLISSQDQREISGAVRQFLRITENFNEMLEVRLIRW